MSAIRNSLGAVSVPRLPAAPYPAAAPKSGTPIRHPQLGAEAPVVGCRPTRRTRRPTPKRHSRRSGGTQHRPPNRRPGRRPVRRRSGPFPGRRGHARAGRRPGRPRLTPWRGRGGGGVEFLGDSHGRPERVEALLAVEARLLREPFHPRGPRLRRGADLTGPVGGRADRIPWNLRENPRGGSRHGGTAPADDRPAGEDESQAALTAAVAAVQCARSAAVSESPPLSGW